MRMGRVLALVAGALVFFIVVLGLAVFLTRDEDNLQADNLLSEAITQRIAEAPEHGDVLDLREVADFPWQRVLIVQPGTSRAQISERLGSEWTGIDTVDGGDLFLFRDGGGEGRALRRLPGFERVRGLRAAVRRVRARSGSVHGPRPRGSPRP